MNIEVTVSVAGDPIGVRMSAPEWTEDQLREVLSRNHFRRARPNDRVLVTVVETLAQWGDSPAPEPRELGEVRP